MNNKDESELNFQILREEDISGLVEAFNFPWTSKEATKEKWEGYYAEQKSDIRAVCIAKVQDEIVYPSWIYSRWSWCNI